MDSQRITLPARELKRLRAPLRLRTVNGTLWITIDGQREDILLAAGESRRFDGKVAVVVYAIGGAASFELTCADGGVRGWRLQRWAERFTTWLRGGRPALGAGA